MLLGQSLLCNLLGKMRASTGPAWFSIIADEATDVVSSEQLDLIKLDHSFTASHILCLQDAGRNFACLRDDSKGD